MLSKGPAPSELSRCRHSGSGLELLSQRALCSESWLAVAGGWMGTALPPSFFPKDSSCTFSWYWDSGERGKPPREGLLVAGWPLWSSQSADLSSLLYLTGRGEGR